MAPKSVFNRLDAFLPGTDNARQAISFLQECIRIDTTNPPGNEIALAEVLKEKFDALACPFLSTTIIETGPSRGNLIVIVHGSGLGSNKNWGFASHLDVVPADGEWQHPPFSGDLVKAEHGEFVWGRGALDMKIAGTSYAVALFALISEGFQPKGDIKIIYESDEETGGHHGMEVLVNDHWDDVKVDALVTEGGGFKFPLGHDVVIQCGEKGKCQMRIRATGKAGHGSMPDHYERFALYKLVQVLDRIRTVKRPVEVGEEYRATINAFSLPRNVKFLLKRKRLLGGLVSLAGKAMHQPELGRAFIPLVTDTIAPTMLRAGVKENVISPEAEVVLDIRTLPHHDRGVIYALIERIVGHNLFSELVLEPVDEMEATTSPPGTPEYHHIWDVMREMYPQVNLVPMLSAGSTDMRYYRMKGVPCYGFVPILKDPDLTYGDMISMPHAPDERVSVDNLMLATEFAYRLMRTV
jgi:acetylornithine deacetylase/succinyl-diaminopimelate desuccinylase-like protein